VRRRDGQPRLLGEFRTHHADALDALFTQVLAALVERGLIKVRRVSQDGVRVRAAAGGGSFRREQRLTQLLDDARKHVAELRRQLDDPAHAAGVGARTAARRRRAAADRVRRIEQAVAQLPELKRKQAAAAKRAGKGKYGKAIRRKQPRVSTTDPEARVMKMPNGGYNPAVNVQLATDTASRAVVGVEVSNEAADSAGLSEPMRQQVQERTGRQVEQHLIDGGYLKTEDIEQAHAAGVELFVPAKAAHDPARRGRELDPKAGDSQAILAWKARMSSVEGKATYKQRAATSETVNGDLRAYRGLTQLTVRGLRKAKCVALWCALAYNVMRFTTVLLAPMAANG
jgi:hypothetical protein